jgi:hypothetical protein
MEIAANGITNVRAAFEISSHSLTFFSHSWLFSKPAAASLYKPFTVQSSLSAAVSLFLSSALFPGRCFV